MCYWWSFWVLYPNPIFPISSVFHCPILHSARILGMHVPCYSRINYGIRWQCLPQIHHYKKQNSKLDDHQPTPTRFQPVFTVQKFETKMLKESNTIWDTMATVWEKFSTITLCFPDTLWTLEDDSDGEQTVLILKGKSR